ncbi:NAD(P)H-dependent oxidoreductase [Catenisphaera adipataccumulans]|jgi:predicted homoserine dehydrogenase-like protein|uniref:Putative homoserine dehydrogenase-like protein n=1 Tax=Catenisphaera adipataccumulans TaxID=700500 RepID=A0A7W8CZX7_9FIRM|nr:NAD(P)-dependent oxidoreductase [Catenisphaera adipataccumulans]MBB5183035.1 putative homoserine dehydrogenase-like protein [Catenisphaera adipataccumulans]
MFNMNRKLAALEEAGKPIQVGVVGAGQMGRGMVTELVLIKGERPAICADINIDLAVHAFEYAGVTEDQIVKTTDPGTASDAIAKGKYVATNDSSLVTKVPEIDVVVDVTGVPDVGARIALDSIAAGKHIVMMNVESDVVIGPYLKKKADEAGVIYTGTSGDEPGTVMELYDFAEAMGFTVEVMGKGKNNRLDYECNPDTVLEEATRRKMSPRMLCAFKDGTKTMVEMTAMSNATGLVPDVIGGHGIACDVKGLNDMYMLKDKGGILNKHGVVEYVRGIAPGVFVTVSTDNQEIAYQMQYHSMGPGPLWTLYRPYHLCNLETPLTIGRAVIYHEPIIVPKNGLVSEVITVAKKDMKAGEKLDGIGGYTTYGSIDTHEHAKKAGYVPFGLINKNAVLKKDVKKGQLLTYDDVEIDTNTLIYKIRAEQDKIFG